jgi:hypothetical protein
VTGAAFRTAIAANLYPAPPWGEETCAEMAVMSKNAWSFVPMDAIFVGVTRMSWSNNILTFVFGMKPMSGVVPVRVKYVVSAVGACTTNNLIVVFLRHVPASDPIQICVGLPNICSVTDFSADASVILEDGNVDDESVSTTGIIRAALMCVCVSMDYLSVEVNKPIDEAKKKKCSEFSPL